MIYIFLAYNVVYASVVVTIDYNTLVWTSTRGNSHLFCHYGICRE
jgi:hypothetical protein